MRVLGPGSRLSHAAGARLHATSLSRTTVFTTPVQQHCYVSVDGVPPGRDMEFPIGTRLKELRKARRLRITGLAEKSGVSTGLISQIERDLVVPSVVNLYRIAQALGTDINYFFENDRARAAAITRRGEHKKMITDQGHGIYELFTSPRREEVNSS